MNKCSNSGIINKKMVDFEKKFEQLNPEMQKKVLGYIELLLMSKQKKKLEFNWMGALKDYRDKYTSLELQKKALDWF